MNIVIIIIRALIFATHDVNFKKAFRRASYTFELRYGRYTTMRSLCIFSQSKDFDLRQKDGVGRLADGQSDV